MTRNFEISQRDTGRNSDARNFAALIYIESDCQLKAGVGGNARVQVDDRAVFPITLRSTRYATATRKRAEVRQDAIVPFERTLNKAFGVIAIWGVGIGNRCIRYTGERAIIE